MKVFPLLLLLGFSLTAAALEPVAKPGLWETVLKNRQIDTAVDQPIARFGKNKGPDPQTAVAASPTASPQVSGNTNHGTGLVDKVCVSSESLALVGMPATVRRDCEYKTRWTKSTAVLQTFCNGVVTSGEINYPNDETYLGWILPSAPWGMGRIEISGRWISADCGAIKP